MLSVYEGRSERKRRGYFCPIPHREREVASTGLHRGTLRVVFDIYIEAATAPRVRRRQHEQDGPFSGLRVINHVGDVVVIELLPDHLPRRRLGEGEHLRLGQVRQTLTGRGILTGGLGSEHSSRYKTCETQDKTDSSEH